MFGLWIMLVDEGYWEHCSWLDQEWWITLRHDTPLGPQRLATIAERLGRWPSGFG